MKRLNILLTAAAALMIVGCAKDKAASGERNGILTVSIKSDKQTRALIDATNTSAVVTAFENNVAGFSAYVFNWDTGDLEARATSADGQPATITGLNTAGSKRVVVIANGTRTDLPNSFIPQFETDPNYSRLADGYLALADQTFTDFTATTKGFLMTGETPSAIQLTAGNNTTNIIVKRVVAKIQLGDITFDDGVQLSDLARFNLTGVSIQRAAGYSTLGTGDISTPATPAVAYMGGEIGSISQNIVPALANAIDLQPYLTDLYTADLGYTGLTDGTLGTTTLGVAKGAKNLTSLDAFKVPAFWYVLPNGDPNNFTLLTLKGTYNNVDFFYPIEINDPDVTGNAAADGTFVKRNTVYTINLKFKNLTGIADPDIPGVAASLEVTVVPAPWEGPVIQNSTW